MPGLRSSCVVECSIAKALEAHRLMPEDIPLVFGMCGTRIRIVTVYVKVLMGIMSSLLFLFSVRRPLRILRRLAPGKIGIPGP